MADTLCVSSSSSSSSYNLKTHTNLQLITCIILHDLSLLCSAITSYPLYFSYVIFFSRYAIKLLSFISPLFIATVFLSLLLTTTTAFCPTLPQLEIGILQTVIQELKSNLNEVHGEEKDWQFEDFEIYKIVFDHTLSIRNCNEDEVEMPLTTKILEHAINDIRSSCYDSDLVELGFEKITGNSVNGSQRNDVTVSDLDSEIIGVEKLLESFVHGCRRNDVTFSDSDTEESGFEKITGNSVSCCQRNHVTVNGSATDKLDFEKITGNSVNSGRINDVAVSDSDKLGFEKITGNSVNGGRRNDVTISDSDADKLSFEKITENSVHSGRRNDVTVSDSDAEILGTEKLLESSANDRRRNDVTFSDSNTVKLGFEKITANSVSGCRRNDVTASDSGPEKLGVEKLLQGSIHDGRIIGVKITVSYVDELENETGFENLLEELDRFEDFTTVTETDTDSDEVIGGLQKANAVENSVRSRSLRSNSWSILNSHGSMKEEKEWRRTLACKLFEERYNSRGGEEGMDSLWEDYDSDNSKNLKQVMINNNGGIERFDNEEQDEDGDDDEEMRSGHLCCLQAMKLSTRKMNLGMGKPNLVKISKALKGFGWLHQVKMKNKHGSRSLDSFMG